MVKRRRVLPDDIIVDIFERLPVESLMRFKCVSKRIFEIIKSPLFIKNNHLRQRSLLLLGTKCLSSHDPESPKLDEVGTNLSLHSSPCIFGDDFPSNHLMGTCNGVVCIVNCRRYYLCNPASKEFMELPLTRTNTCAFAQGFGNDCSTFNNEFKIVFVYSYGVQLYCVTTNSWKKIDTDLKIKGHIRYLPGSQFLFNGCCYWRVFDEGSLFNEDDDRNSILSFNFCTEVFQKLEYPDFASYREIPNHQLVVFEGCLTMIGYQENSQLVEIYVMKESWTKQFVTGPYPSIYCLMPWKNDYWRCTKGLNNRWVSEANYDETRMNRFEKTMRSLTYKPSLLGFDEVIRCAT